MPKGWEKVQLGELVTFAGGSSFPPKHQGNATGTWPFYKVSDMNSPGNERGMFAAVNYVGASEQSVLRFRVWPSGTVIFPKVGAALLTEKRRYLTSDSVFDNNIMGLVAGPRILPEYLFAVMTGIRLGEFAQQGAVPSINQTHVSGVEISLPELEEQRRIVDLVHALDDCVDAAHQINIAAEQTLLQLRETLFSPTENSECVALGDVIERVSIPVKVQGESSYVELGVRSHGRGTFLKEAVDGMALGKKKVFYMTPGLLVFNIVFAWEGAVSILGDEVEGTVASHRFPTYRGRQPLALEIVDHFFQTNRGRDVLRLTSPGGAGRNKTLNQGALLRTTASLPPRSKWLVTTEALAAARENAAATAGHAASLRKLRTELLSTLLSGAHRIPETYDELMGA